MRKLIFAINITIDGCVDHTKSDGSAEIHDFFARLMDDVDLLVFGRKTYELMVPYWPDMAKNPSGEASADEFARTFDSKRKIVFSQTLENTEDKNTVIVRTDLRDEIRKLKQQPGKNILLGGVTLPSQLIADGLVDEYYFVVNPVIAGEGTRLLQGISLQDGLHLKLIDAKVLTSGYVAVHYSR